MWDESEEVGIQDGSADLPLVIMGTHSGLEARSAVYSYLNDLGIGDEYHGLALMSVALKRQPAADGIFFATARYQQILNRMRFSLDGTAEKVKKTRSLETIANYQVRDVANLGWAGPSFGQLVNVGRESVEGVEVYAPGTFKLTISWTAKYESIDATYIQTCLELAATVNDRQIVLNYRGQQLIFEKGTLLFVGGTFDESSTDGADITLKFEGSATDDVAIGEVNTSNPATWIGSGDTTTGSATITNMTEEVVDTLVVGMTVTGTGIPAGSRIVSFPSTTSIEISSAATATNAATALGFYLTGIPKEGWYYLWVRTARVPDDAAGVQVDVPDSAHVERFYNYSDFTQLRVFDSVQDFDDEFEEAIDDELLEEIADDYSQYTKSNRTP